MSKRQKWAVGDIFRIPLKDSTFGYGQVIDHLMKHVIAIALFDARDITSKQVEAVDPGRHIGTVVAMRAYLDSGVWEIVSHREVLVEEENKKYEQFRSTNWVGLKVTSPGIAQSFLSAYHGLIPWDCLVDPKYFDTLLLDSIGFPESAYLSKSE